MVQSVLSLSLDELCAKLQKREIACEELGVVSADESAVWLIDYWCSKDISGLIKMPLSRHWIMHIEAANRIKEKILDR